MPRIETPYSTIWTDDEGLMYVRFTDLAEMGAPEAMEHIHAVLNCMDGKPYPIITDGRDMYGTMHPEARNLIATHTDLVKLRKAQALVTNRLQTKLLAEIYIRFHKPSNPAKVFGDMDQAKEWIRQFI